MIAQGLHFLDAKNYCKIRTGSPSVGLQMQMGWVEIATFDEKHAISWKQYKIDA